MTLTDLNAPDFALTAAFRAGFRGELIEPHDRGYDDARSVYNGMIDRRPRLIARCTDAADVIAAVALARETGAPLAVRGGGHNAGGLGVWDDAIVVDLSARRSVASTRSTAPSASTAAPLGATSTTPRMRSVSRSRAASSRRPASAA